MEKENSNFEPVDLEQMDSNFNFSEKNSCDNVVNMGCDSKIPVGFKQATILVHGNAAENLKDDSASDTSIYKTSEKNITENTKSKSHNDQNEIENKDPNTSNNNDKINFDDEKLKIIPVYEHEENINAAKADRDLYESKVTIDHEIKITAKAENKPFDNTDHTEKTPKINSEININKPNDDRNDRRTNIFKKTDITQGSSYDFIFKIALIGDSGIGKTSILIRFVDDSFKNETSSTIGVDFKLVSFRIEDKLAKMQIWDTCGSERFKALTSSFIKSCSVFMLVFDLTRQKSFLNLESWIKLIKENVNPKLLCLVGNKADLEDQRQVTLEEAIKFSNKHELKYMETSARTNFGIENLFSYIAEKLYDDIITMRNLERESRKSKSKKNNSKAFELGPSANINKVEDKNKNSESDDDEVSEEHNKKGKKLSKKMNECDAKRRKCNC